MSDNNTIVVNSNDESLAVIGSNNVITVNGTGDNVSVGGNGDSVTSGADTITALDDTTNLSVGGQGYTALAGSNISAAINGIGVTLFVNGNANTLTSAVNGESITIAGNTDNAIINGQTINATLTGASSNSNIVINAQYVMALVQGVANYLTLNGQNGAVSLTGSNNTVNTAGNKITILDGATGASIQGGGNSDVIGSGVSAAIASYGGDTILVSGDNSSLDISDSYSDFIISGSNDFLHTLDGSFNTIALAGNGNSVLALGTGDLISVTGQGQRLATNAATITVAPGAALTLASTANAYEASSGNIINLGANATLSVQGGNNWVNAAGGDSVDFSGYPYGSGNGIGGAGTGSSVTFHQDGYALLSQSMIAFNGDEGVAGVVAIQGQVTGNGNTITATAGATVSVTGTGNTIAASGVAITLAGPPQPPGSPLAVRGFAFPSYSGTDFNTAVSTASLGALQATGANAVEIVFSQYLYDPGLPDQDAYTINPSVPQRTADDGTALPAKESVSDADLIAQIRQAESDGLQVLLKPHIDPADGTWRALQTPQNIPAFFANYQNFIVHYAQIAQETGVQTFSIGCELESLTGQQYLPYWTQIIDAVRQVYSGQLTYASATYEIGTVSFWSQLDIIGTDAYERTSSQLDPTEAQLQAGWTQPLPAASNPVFSGTNTQGFFDSNGVAVSPIAEYENLAEQYNKPILITEAGYASVNETDLLEGDGDRNATTYVDYQQQANAYQALLSALAQNNSILPGQSSQWLDGAYLWDWSPNPASVTADDTSVQGKPAIAAVENAFDPVSPAAGAAPDTINGTGNTITSVTSGASLNVAGSDDAISMATDGYLGLMGGSGHSVTATADTIATAANTSFILYGSDDSVTLGADSYLGLVGGAGNIVSNVNAGTVVNLVNGASASVIGSGGSIGVFGSATVATSNESITLAAGQPDSVGLVGGAGNTVIGNNAGDVVNLVTGASATILGSGGSIGIFGSATVTASNQSIVFGAGQPDTVSLLGGAGNTVINDNAGDTVNMAYGASATILGSGGIIGIYGSASVTASNAAIVLGGGQPDTLGLIGGSGNTVAGANAGNVVNMTNGATATVLGSGGSIGIFGSATVMTSNESISFGAGQPDSVGLVGGAGNTVINDNAGDVVNLVNGATATILGSGGGIGIFGSATVTASNQSIAFGAGQPNTVSLLGGAGNTVINDNAGDAVNMAYGASATILGSGGIIGIYGSASVTASNANIVLGAGQPDSLTVAGAGNIVSLTGPGAAIAFINASGDVTTGTAAALMNTTFSGFAAGFTIDVNDLIASAAAFSLSFAGNGAAGVLSVTDGVHHTQIDLTGSYANSMFHSAADGHGGTLLTLSTSG